MSGAYAGMLAARLLSRAEGCFWRRWTVARPVGVCKSVLRIPRNSAEGKPEPWSSASLRASASVGLLGPQARSLPTALAAGWLPSVWRSAMSAVRISWLFRHSPDPSSAAAYGRSRRDPDASSATIVSALLSAAGHLREKRGVALLV